MMLRSILLLFGTVCVLVPYCLPQARPQVRTRPAFMSQLKAFEESPIATRAVLKNGLTILVNEFHAVPVLGFSATVKSGYAQDPPGQAGMAKLLQRMLLSRVETGGGGRILREDIRALGGELEGVADAQETTYRLTVPSAQWKKAVEHLAQLLLSPAWDEERLRQQVARLRTEEGFEPGSPAARSRRRLAELLLGRDRVAAWDPRRFTPSVELDLESVSRHYAAEYAAPAITIVVSGDVVASEVMAEIVKAFAGARSPAPKPRAAVQVEDPGGFQYEQLRGAGSRARVLAGFRVPAASSPEYAAIEVLRALLATGEGSILARRLRDEKKAVQRFTSELLGYPGGSLLLLEMELDPADIDPCEIALFAELEILKLAEPGAAAMERAFAQLEVAHWSALQTVTQRAERMSFFENLGRRGGMEAYPSSIRRVKPADVIASAQKYLYLENCAILEFLPDGSEPRNVTRETLKDIIEVILEVSSKEELAKREKETVPAYSLPEARPVFSFSEVRYPFRKASILRGPELYIREDRTLPLIDIGFFFPGGRLAESVENRGISALMLRSLFRNAGTEEEADPLTQLEIYGGVLRPVIEPDYFGAYLTVLSHNVEDALDVFLRLIKSPGFDEDKIEREKVVLAGDLRAVGEEEEGYAARRLRGMLFGEHPYAMTAGEAAEAVRGIDRAGVQDWYKRTVENRKPVVVMIGNTRGTSLASYFVRNFSGSRYEDAEIPESFPVQPAEPKHLEEAWAHSRSAVALGYVLPPWGDEDLFPVALIGEHLKSIGGPLGAGLSSAGDGEGLVGTCRLESWLRGGLLTVVALTAPGTEAKTLEALRQGMANLAEKQILYRDYRSAVHAAEGNYWISRQSRETQTAGLVMNVLAGLGLDELQDYPTRLREVTEDDFQETVMRFLKPAKAAELILRGSGGTEQPK